MCQEKEHNREESSVKKVIMEVTLIVLSRDGLVSTRIQLPGGNEKTIVERKTSKLSHPDSQ